MGSAMTTKTTQIGIIISSARPHRIGPQLATKFLLPKFQPSLPPNTTLETIDLAEWNLPMFNETAVPADDPTMSKYTLPHSQKWSKAIQKFSAFVFLTPEYNGGYPAPLKNAIDYLFHEWTGKPAFVIAYGGHGGKTAGESFAAVLNRIHMNVVEPMPLLALGKDGTFPAAREGTIVEGKFEEWELNQGAVLTEGWDKLIELLSSASKDASKEA
ncbi:MAG: hypothetical protein M1834_009050 [Cirrosporium novae-zelandiae]|nr:MAG: hypothetical protein M1834_009050 [Cirrosporium novae-zelandiae]